MAADEGTRRSALKIIGAIGTTCAFPFSADELYGQASDHAGHPVVPVEHNRNYFPESDFRLVSRIADLILPETDTPGAVAAGVPGYIDYVVGSNKQHQSVFRAGLEWLNGQNFVSLDEEQQIAILIPLSNAVDENRANSAPEKFFAVMKALTADGYFTSKIGLMDTLRYKGNSVVPEFTGCTHEH